MSENTSVLLFLGLPWLEFLILLSLFLTSCSPWHFGSANWMVNAQCFPFLMCWRQLSLQGTVARTGVPVCRKGSTRRFQSSWCCRSLPQSHSASGQFSGIPHIAYGYFLPMFPLSQCSLMSLVEIESRNSLGKDLQRGWGKYCLWAGAKL